MLDRCNDIFSRSKWSWKLDPEDSTCTHSQSVVPARLLSSPQCHTSTQRQVSVASSGSQQGPSPGTGSHQPAPPYPRSISCHVLRCIHTNSDPFLHTSYCEYCPITRSARVPIHVISHNDIAQSHRRSRLLPCHSLSSQSSTGWGWKSCHKSEYTSTCDNQLSLSADESPHCTILPWCWVFQIAGLLLNPAVCERALFPKFASLICLVHKAP